MCNDVEESLRAAQDSLSRGVMLSGQGSCDRRAPEPESLPHFAEASRLLSGILTHSPDNRDALVMMSRIAENLMDYEAAINFLNQAFEAGVSRDKKSLKRLALLRECENEWRDLLLTPEMLRELGNYLEDMEVGPQHRNMDLTQKWLSENLDGSPEKYLAALERRGAFSDFQVLANVVYG